MFNCYQILLFPTWLFEYICIFMGIMPTNWHILSILPSIGGDKFTQISLDLFFSKEADWKRKLTICLMLLLLSVWKANFCLNFRVFSFTPPRAIRARRCLLLAVNGKIIRAFGAMKGSTFACVIAFFYAQNCGKNLATKRRPPHFLGTEHKSARHCQFIVINCEELGKIHGTIECFIMLSVLGR